MGRWVKWTECDEEWADAHYGWRQSDREVKSNVIKTRDMSGCE